MQYSMPARAEGGERGLVERQGKGEGEGRTEVEVVVRLEGVVEGYDEGVV